MFSLFSVFDSIVQQISKEPCQQLTVRLEKNRMFRMQKFHLKLIFHKRRRHLVEHLLHQLRTLAHAFLPEKAAENTLRICHYANVNFTGFFVGKIIDSAIIGVITFVAMAILRLDFALLISVFIGITNIIPVFGPFIGAIPSIFILLLVDPIQAVIFGVLILVIQQVDGNFIGPKILGSSIGISALWILFSIVVGGDLFGLVGMVVGVPLFATFYGLAREFVHYMLDKRGLDSEGNHVGEVVEDEENVFE